jgi:hypothetical protein
VLDSCRYLQQRGFDVTYLPVEKSGLVNLQQLADAIRPETSLVSVMAVNNEIGVVQPLAEIGKLCREKKVFFHTDAAQAVGKLPIDVNAMHIDLLSISGHKLYGPKGIGALYIRRRPRVRLEAQMSGGGQERGLRSGTVPHFLAVGGCAGARPPPPGGHAAAVRVAPRSRIPRQQPGATAVPLMLAESGQRSCKLPGARTCTRQACGAPPSPPCRPGRGLRRGGARDAAGPGAHQAPERAAVQRHHIAAAGARSWLAALARQARRSALSP